MHFQGQRPSNRYLFFVVHRDSGGIEPSPTDPNPPKPMPYELIVYREPPSNLFLLARVIALVECIPMPKMQSAPAPPTIRPSCPLKRPPKPRHSISAAELIISQNELDTIHQADHEEKVKLPIMKNAEALLLLELFLAPRDFVLVSYMEFLFASSNGHL